MPTYTTKRRVAFTPRQMFDLVADVEQYPQFLPLCEGLSIRERTAQGRETIIVATMAIGYKAIRERFTTRVTLKPDDNVILVEYLDGPFRHLENRWAFLPVADGTCEVDFYITYEFRSRMLGALMGALFDKAFRKFAEAFETRARKIYGTSHREVAREAPSGRLGSPAAGI